MTQVLVYFNYSLQFFSLIFILLLTLFYGLSHSVIIRTTNGCENVLKLQSRWKVEKKNSGCIVEGCHPLGLVAIKFSSGSSYVGVFFLG